MKFKILEEAIFLIITLNLIHQINTQEQRRRFSKNYCIHLEPHTNTRTPDPRAMDFTILEEALTLPHHNYVLMVHLLNIQEERRRILKNECILSLKSLEPLPNIKTLARGHEIHNSGEVYWIDPQWNASPGPSSAILGIIASLDVNYQQAWDGVLR
uniref:Uncharacterized protein n=1 Tax=Magallana gigas TaxID=29159 RepID=K1RP28_MAGGI